MGALGARQLLDIAIPTGVDGNEVMRSQLESGVTVQEAVTRVTQIIGDANDFLFSRYGGLFMQTSMPYVRYRQGDGTTTMTPESSELKSVDGVRGDQIGHMLPRRDFDDALAWTSRYLKRADPLLLQIDAETVRDRWINRVDYDMLKRMFSKTENSIGSAGYDVPWVNGTDGSVDYIPPAWMGKTFASTHTHFIRINAAISNTNTLSTLSTMAGHLSEHNHSGRKVAYVSETDLSKYTTIANDKFIPFVPREGRVVGSGASGSSYAVTAEGELQGVPGELFGYVITDYGVVEMRYLPRVPAGYLWMGKSYGINNTRNPLAVRTDPEGFGLVIRPQIVYMPNPEIVKLSVQATHGVGVNDRTNGVAAQIASGGTSYDEPTIS